MKERRWLGKSTPCDMPALGLQQKFFVMLVLLPQLVLHLHFSALGRSATDSYRSGPCIRGHRSSKCQHHDRVLIEVRKPGRPLSSCPHPAGSCGCERITVSYTVPTSMFASTKRAAFTNYSRCIATLLPNTLRCSCGCPWNSLHPCTEEQKPKVPQQHYPFNRGEGSQRRVALER